MQNYNIIKTITVTTPVDPADPDFNPTSVPKHKGVYISFGTGEYTLQFLKIDGTATSGISINAANETIFFPFRLYDITYADDGCHVLFVT